MWKNRRLFHKARPAYCPKCLTGTLRLRAGKPPNGPRWWCKGCKARWGVVEIPLRRLEGRPVGWSYTRVKAEDIDHKLRVMVAHAPMAVKELAIRLGVSVYTVRYHVLGRQRGPNITGLPPAEDLHLFDGQVFKGTMAEWGHYP